MWRSTPSGRPFPAHDNDRKSRLDVHNVPCGRDKMHGDTVWNQGPLYSSEWSAGYGEERCKVKDECTVSGAGSLPAGGHMQAGKVERQVRASSFDHHSPMVKLLAS